MAYEDPGKSISLEAAADLSGSQFFLVKVDATGKAALAGLGELGRPLQDKPKAGEVGAIMVDGISKVVAGAAITAGDLVSSDAAGKGKTAVVTESILGTALTAAGGADEVIEVLLHAAGAVV